MLHRGGPQLPYQVVAGVVPCRAGWLVSSCKLAGATLSVEEPTYFTNFLEILDYKPTYSVVGVHAPIGYLDEMSPGGRSCDREVRARLGAHRGTTIRSAPSRSVLRGEVSDGIDAITKILLPHYREIAEVVAPYRQRTVYEVEPELTFYELNYQQPLQHPKHTELGRQERREILEARIDGVDRILDAELPRVKQAHLIDAAACMWTARRIFAKVGSRYPEDPEWDSEGIRMEIIC